MIVKQIAEWVLPGHPDKLADRIADSLVDEAVSLDPRALVGVEVAVHRNAVFIDGRIGCPGSVAIDVAAAVRRIYRESGYTSQILPDPDTLRIETDLCLGDFTEGEREYRSLADDQNIVTGYAEANEVTNFLPLAPALARGLGQKLARFCQDYPEIGPDGKVIVILNQPPDDCPTLETVSFSIHHREAVSLVDIRRVAKEILAEIGNELAPCQIDVQRTKILTNGAGHFAIGGPEGDNGLSGKKLVVDAYGPNVPIGGGALSGKDPHKIDRVFALRARQIAKHLVLTGLAEQAFVQLATTPGETGPVGVTVSFGRRKGTTQIWKPAPERLVGRWLAGYDLTIDGSHRDLGLAAVRWEPLATQGHFWDPDLPWERWHPGRISS